jgi:hypothetical protein
MDNQSYDYNDEPVFHEHPQLLAEKAYRGFSVKNIEQHYEGVKITAANKEGKSFTATGETEKEALKKLIDHIDLMLDQ